MSHPGSASRSPSIAEHVDGGRTRDDPWSPRLAASASRPNTATDPIPAGSGSTSPSFFSSTIDSAATRRARARWAVEATTDACGSAGSRRARCSSCVRRMRRTDDTTVVRESRPDRAASGSARARESRSGISTSMPASRLATGSCTPNTQSLVTKPVKPHSSRSTSVRSAPFTSIGAPLTEL